jgi:aconitate hydratase
VIAGEYAGIETSNEEWNRISASGESLYRWDAKSTYIQEPPFFLDRSREPAPVASIQDARVLVIAGVSVTTDHISPAGAIANDGPAGTYLVEQGVEPIDGGSVLPRWWDLADGPARVSRVAASPVYDRIPLSTFLTHTCNQTPP